MMTNANFTLDVCNILFILTTVFIFIFIYYCYLSSVVETFFHCYSVTFTQLKDPSVLHHCNRVKQRMGCLGCVTAALHFKPQTTSGFRPCGHGRRGDMWRMSGRDPGKSPVVTKWAEKAWSLRKERGQRRAHAGDISVKWWGEKPWLAESTQSPSLPVVAPRLGVFTHLSKNVEERGWGSVKNDPTRGVCHIVWRWHLRRPTGPRSGQPATPAVLPSGERGVSMSSHSHTRVSACLAAHPDSAGLCRDWSGVFKSPLCSLHAAWIWLSSLFLVVKSFHTTQFPFPNHESAEQRSRQCSSPCLSN